jgi:hypothetical protein
MNIQFETKHYQTGAEMIEEAVRECWASGEDEEARAAASP